MEALRYKEMKIHEHDAGQGHLEPRTFTYEN